MSRKRTKKNIKRERKCRVQHKTKLTITQLATGEISISEPFGKQLRQSEKLPQTDTVLTASVSFSG